LLNKRKKFNDINLATKRDNWRHTKLQAQGHARKMETVPRKQSLGSEH